MKIRIKWLKGEITAELGDNALSKELARKLPFESRANTWGDEVYFKAPVRAALEADARDVVNKGTVCFWVEGASIAIPFGPTPVSRGNECRLVTKVNVLGKVEGDPAALKSVRNGEKLSVEKI